MSLSDFKLSCPRTLAEALHLLARHDEAQVIAGGTDLIPSLRQRLFAPRHVLDIRGIAELRGIRELPDGGVEIGALTTLRTIENSELVRRGYSVLAQAAKTVASPVIRNMGTLGGNICLDTRCLWYNQSLQWRKSCGFCIKKDGDLCHVAPGGDRCWAVFSGDTPPALLCLCAEIEIAGPNGSRRIPLADFYTNDGAARMKLATNEIVTRVFLPASTANWRGAYLKLRTRGSIDYPLAGVAVALKANGMIEDIKIAITAVNPAPLLVPGAAKVLAGRELTEEVAAQVAELAARTAKPLTTSALTPEYRREMVRVYTRRALLAAAQGRH
jgi:4-hydroxybenzoyl-CoA reductase subunit beta